MFLLIMGCTISEGKRGLRAIENKVSPCCACGEFMMQLGPELAPDWWEKGL